MVCKLLRQHSVSWSSLSSGVAFCTIELKSKWDSNRIQEKKKESRIWNLQVPPSFISVYLFMLNSVFAIAKRFSVGVRCMSDSILKHISLEYHELLIRKKMYYSVILKEKSGKDSDCLDLVLKPSIKLYLWWEGWNILIGMDGRCGWHHHDWRYTTYCSVIGSLILQPHGLFFLLKDCLEK